MPTISMDKNAFYREAKALGFLSVILLLLYFPLVFGNKTVFDSDTTFFNVPMYAYLHQAYQEGFIPFWKPGLFTGLPFMAALQTEVFYPPSLIFFLSDFMLAFNLSLVFHHTILISGIYVLLRFWGVSPMAAVCSCLTALLGGFFLSISSLSNHFHSIAWFPWFFFFFEKFLRENHIRYLILSITACSIQTLAGSPEFSILSTLLIFFHALGSHQKTKGNRVARNSLWMGLVMLCSLALTAFQLLPSYHFAQNSTRALGLKYADHAHWSLAPSALSQLFVPASPEAISLQFQNQAKMAFIDILYMGILPALCLVAAVFFFKTHRRIYFWWIVFWVGIFLSLGKFNPLYPFLYDWVPLLKQFRYPEKFFFLSAFSMTYLVGMTLDALITTGQTASASLKKGFGILLAAMVVGFFIYSINAETASFYPQIFLALFGLSCGLFFWNRITPTLVWGITLFVILTDLMIHNQSLIVFTDRKFFDDTPPIAKTLNQDHDHFRIFSQADLLRTYQNPPPNENSQTLMNYQDIKNILHSSLGTLYGLQTLQGSLGVETRDQGIFNHIFFDLREKRKLEILKRFNVKYTVTAGKWEQSPDGTLINPKAQLTRLDALPRAFMVSGAQAMNPLLIPETYFNSDFDPRAHVLVDSPLPAASDTPFQGEVVTLKYQPNSVEIRTRQKGKGYLVLLDAYYPGWQATVDGKAATILRGNHFFRTLPLDEGDHQVIFHYEQEGFRAGFVISGATLVFLMGGCIGITLLTHKKRRPTSERLFSFPE